MFSKMHIPEELRAEHIRPLSVADVDQLLKSGAIESGERIELLHGMLVVMDMDGEPHVWVTQRLMKRLVVATLEMPVEVICQSSAKMGDFQLPSPDITVVPRQTRFTRPLGGLLVIEVAESSLRKDRVIKVPIYATAGVPEYWIVDTENERVFVHTEPHGRDYRAVEVVPRSGTLRPRELPGVEIVVDELFHQE